MKTRCDRACDHHVSARVIKKKRLFLVKGLRTSAYSNDLTWRIVWQHEAQGKSLSAIAESLCVDKFTVSRILRLFRQTGQISKKTYPKERSFRKLTSPAELLILHLVIERPGIYLREIQYRWND